MAPWKSSPQITTVEDVVCAYKVSVPRSRLWLRILMADASSVWASQGKKYKVSSAIRKRLVQSGFLVPEPEPAAIADVMAVVWVGRRQPDRVWGDAGVPYIPQGCIKQLFFVHVLTVGIYTVYRLSFFPAGNALDVIGIHIG